MTQENCVPHLVPFFSHFMVAQYKKCVPNIQKHYIVYYIHQLNDESLFDIVRGSDTVSLQHVRLSQQSDCRPR